MTEPVTMKLTIIDGKNSCKMDYKVENKNLMKDLFPHFNDETNVVTLDEFKRLARVAGNTGESDVLEELDVIGIRNLRTEIEKGNADWKSGILNLIFNHGYNNGDIELRNVKTTLGNVKDMYNLPEGSLRKYCINNYQGSKFDDYVPKKNSKVWFSLETFAESNGLTIQEVIDMFPKKSAFSAIF